MEPPKIKEIVTCLSYAAHKMRSFVGAHKRGQVTVPAPHGVPP